MATIEISNDYTELAYKIIKREPELQYILDNDIQFCVLVSDQEKVTNHKKVFADCRKVAETYKPFCPYEFLITIYDPNCMEFNNKQMEILLHHEMKHIGVDADNGSLYVAPHDIEEFNSIYEKYGLNWCEKGGV